MKTAVAMLVGLSVLAGCGADGPPIRPTAAISITPSGVRIVPTVSTNVGPASVRVSG
jgi:hypothetical protein